MKRLINNVLIILSALIIAVSFSWVFSNRVEAVTNGSVTVKIAPDSSKQKESKVLIVNVSLAGFKNVNLNTPIAMSAVLNYDTSIFSGATITGKNGYSAIMANNKMVIDSNSAKDGDIIAEIDFTIKPNISANTKTDIKLSSIEIANDDTLDMNISELKAQATILKNVTTPASADTKNDDQDKKNDINNKTSVNNVADDKNNATNNTTNETNKNGILITNEIKNDNKNNSQTTKATTNATEDKKVTPIEPIKDTTTSKKSIPQTGEAPIAIIAIATLIVVGIVTFIRYKKFYD